MQPMSTIDSIIVVVFKLIEIELLPQYRPMMILTILTEEFLLIGCFSRIRQE